MTFEKELQRLIDGHKTETDRILTEASKLPSGLDSPYMRAIKELDARTFRERAALKQKYGK